MSEYLVKRTGQPWDAVIYLAGSQVGSIRKGDNLSYVLASKDGREWKMEARVHGEVRPFSLAIFADGSHPSDVLTISDHLFKHKGKFYMLTNSPEGRPLADFALGKRYICRLDNFPFSDLREVDHETKGRIDRYRGVPVGEMDGLGTEGHKVTLSAELEDIGLQLSAASYLIYATA